MSGYYLDEWISPNCNVGNYQKVGFTIHHAATTDFSGIGRTFQNPARQASAHYGVEPGHVQRYVPDPYIAWHAGDSWANRSTIGIECVNSGGEAQGWPVAEETVDTLVEFLADKCRELGIGSLVVGENLFGHKDFSATFCPGVLYPRLGEIADRVNARLRGEDDMTPEEHEWLATVFEQQTGTYDPTGRNIALNDHDHIKWIGAKVSDLDAKIEKIMEMLDK